MAARLAGRSNASFCKRLLGRSHLVRATIEIYPEIANHRSSRNERFSSGLGRFGASRGFSTFFSENFSGPFFQVSWITSSPQGAYSSRNYLNSLQERFQGFSTIQEVDSGSKEAENVIHPTPGDLRLPKLVNPTSERVKKVCGILEKREWGNETISELEEADVIVSPYLVQLVVLRIINNESLAWNFFKWARERATMKLSLRAYIALVDSLGRAKNLELLKQVIKLMVQDGYSSSAWPYNNILKWFSDDVDTVLHFWGLMKENKCRPTVITYTRVIDALSKHGRIEAASEIFREMLKDGCPPNITTYNVLIHAFGAAGQPEAASELFNKLSELGCRPNYETYSALIMMHAKAGNTEAAMKYFNLLKLTGADIGEQVYEALQMPLPEGLTDSSTTRNNGAGVTEFDHSNSDLTPGRIMSPNKLLSLIFKGENMPVGEKLDKIRPRIYPQFVVQVMQRMKNPDDALTFFDWAKRQPNFRHNEYSYSMIISILGRSRNSDVIERILGEMYEQGIQINTQIFTALITCYGRARSLTGALQLFQQMKDWGCKPDIITYTSLIHLLAKHGYHDQANEMFLEMQQAGCVPNYRTYSVVIYILLKSGKFNEAVDLLKQMPELGCKPSAVTYATVIHHLAKDGRVDLARDIFSLMESSGVKPLMTTVIDLDSAFKKAGSRLFPWRGGFSKSAPKLITSFGREAHTERQVLRRVSYHLSSGLHLKASPFKERSDGEVEDSLKLTGRVIHHVVYQEGRQFPLSLWLTEILEPSQMYMSNHMSMKS
ncbi:hypothetical protein R1flu_011855 [Riccia fluitans]|uniref:Pentatricopeptide repeat-containing protein n=1 Tax=Riccia fluitans TaxID=41844 RepID=A0ABD1ZA35_9MARC